MTPRVAWRAVGVLAAVALMLGALPSVLAMTFRQSTEQTFDLSTEATLSRVAVRLDNGDLEVRVVPPGEQPYATVRTTYTLTEPENAVTVDDRGEVTLRSDCPTWSVGCRVTWELGLPADVALDVDAAAVQVRACDLTGPVTIDVATGAVDLCRIRSDELDVSASAGAIGIEFAEPPQRVAVTTSVGDISVTVPDDGTVYDVRSRVSVGSVDNRLRSDPAESRVIDVSANVGDVTLLAR